MDGLGCYLLLRDCFQKEKVEVFPCTYRNVFDVFQTIKPSKKDIVFITDISVCCNLLPENYILLDHHESAVPLLASEKNLIVKIGCSATKLTMAYLKYKYNYKPSKDMISLCKYIDDYDTFRHKYRAGIHLNRLYWVIGFSGFLEMFKDGFSGFNKKAREILIREEQTLQKMFKETEYTIINKVAFAIVPQRGVDEYCAKLLKENVDLQFIIVYNAKNKLSLRSRSIPINKIAEEFGGGGHPLACGIEIKENENVEEKIEKLIRGLNDEVGPQL